MDYKQHQVYLIINGEEYKANDYFSTEKAIKNIHYILDLYAALTEDFNTHTIHVLENQYKIKRKYLFKLLKSEVPMKIKTKVIQLVSNV